MSKDTIEHLQDRIVHMAKVDAESMGASLDERIRQIVREEIATALAAPKGKHVRFRDGSTRLFPDAVTSATREDGVMLLLDGDGKVLTELEGWTSMRPMDRLDGLDARVSDAQAATEKASTDAALAQSLADAASANAFQAQSMAIAPR